MERENKNNQNFLILGLGHTGCAVLKSVSGKIDAKDISCIGVDTDAKEIEGLSEAGISSVLLGSDAVNGLGTGGDREMGRRIIADASEELLSKISGCRVLMAIAGLGGGTGSAVDKILELAEELNVPAILLAVMPFSYESNERKVQASEALSEMEVYCQAVILAPNDKIYEKFKDEKVADAYSYALEYLGKAAIAVSTPFSSKNLLNVNPYIFNSLSRGNSTRCYFAQVEIDTAEHLTELKDKLEGEFIFREEPVKNGIDRSVAFLRVCGSCNESEMEYVFDIVRKMLPEKEIEVAACLDERIDAYAHLTLVVHTDTLESEWRGEAVDVPVISTPLEPVQTGIVFPEDERGIFVNESPVEIGGVDIDVPTFRRRGITIDKGV